MTVAGDVLGDVLRCAADAVDEVGVAEVLEALSEHIHARHRRDTAVLADLAVVVEDGQVEPFVGDGGGRWPRSRC